jgi:hypothetical protein
VEIKMKRILLILIALAFVIPTFAQAPGGTGGTPGNAAPGGDGASPGPKAPDKMPPHKTKKMMKKKKKATNDSSPSSNPSPAAAPQNNP